MINREAGLLEIYNRIKADRVTLGITSFKRIPTAPSEFSDLPCVFMLEGVDVVIKASARSNHGYPCTRNLEVPLELVTKDSTDIKTLYLGLRRTVFKEIGSDPPVYNAIIANNTFINENRTEGPMSYGLPDILVMRLVLNLIYTDNGGF